MTHLSAHNLLSNRQHGFRKGRSTGDLLAFLIQYCSSSFKDFGKIFAVSLEISKTFDRVWHKSLISKLPSHGFYPSLCTFISSFLSDSYIAAVVEGHCYSPKTINSSVSQDSVLSPTLFQLLIYYLLILTKCSVYSYADDTTLHFSTSYNRHPTKQELIDAIGRLTSDLSLVSDCGRENLVLFNVSKNLISTTIYSI